MTDNLSNPGTFDGDLLELLEEIALDFTDDDAVLRETYSTAGHLVDAHEVADWLSSLTIGGSPRLDTERVDVDVDGETVVVKHYRQLEDDPGPGRLGPLYLLLSGTLRYVSDRDTETAFEMLDTLAMEVEAAANNE